MWPFGWLKRRRANRRAIEAEQKALEAEQQAAMSADTAQHAKEKAASAEEIAQITEDDAARAESVVRLRWLKAHELRDSADNLADKNARSNPTEISSVGHDWFIHPRKAYEAHILLKNRRIIPKARGAYAWYFRGGTLPVPRCGYFQVNGFELLYIGIAGDRSRPDGRGHLRMRILQHLTNNAYGSSLRLSLGILLEDQFRIKLIPQGRRGFRWSDEKCLSDWIRENAMVAWIEDARPWLLEHDAIRSYGEILPLNYKYNENCPFAIRLKHLRDEHRARVRHAREV